jgi:hypothetical protein
MKVLPFEQSSRPALSTLSAAAPAKETQKPDADPARPRTTSPFGPFGDEGHPHEEPGYGHGV